MAEILYYETNGVDEVKEKQAFNWLIAQPGDHAIVAYQKSSLKSFLERIIADSGSRNRDRFLRNNRISIGDNNIDLYTQQIAMPLHIQASIIWLYPTRNNLNELERYRNLTSVMVIPWTTKECQDWLQQHGARQVFQE